MKTKKLLPFSLATSVLSLSLLATPAFSANATSIEDKVELHNSIKNQYKKADKKTVLFVKSIAEDAHKYSKEYRVYPSIVIASAILESKSGTSTLAKKGNNLYGLKYEDMGISSGHYIDYKSKKESVKDYASHLANSSKFITGSLKDSAMIIDISDSPEQALRFIDGEKDNNPSKTSKLIQIINTYNLTRFDDDKLSKDTRLWLKSKETNPYKKVSDLVEISRTTKLPKSVSNADKLKYMALDPSYFNKQYIYEELSMKGKIPDFEKKSKIKIDNFIKINYKKDGENVVRYAIINKIVDNKVVFSEAVKKGDKLYIVKQEISKKTLETKKSKYKILGHTKLYANK